MESELKNKGVRYLFVLFGFMQLYVAPPTRD